MVGTLSFQFSFKSNNYSVLFPLGHGQANCHWSQLIVEAVCSLQDHVNAGCFVGCVYYNTNKTWLILPRCVHLASLSTLWFRTNGEQGLVCRPPKDVSSRSQGGTQPLRTHRGIIWPTPLTDTAVLAQLADTPLWAFKLKREESGFSLLITAKLKLAGCIDQTDYNGHSLSNLS